MNPAYSADRPAVLTCWKDIAKYMGKGVRTVQRWEQEFGLPVRRPLGSNKKAVLARPQDLDAWVALRCGSRRQAAWLDVPVASRKEPMTKLVALAAQIERSRQLRENNRELIKDVRCALMDLQTQILSLHQDN